jgi:sugar lactone lactonase YvrE
MRRIALVAAVLVLAAPVALAKGSFPEVIPLPNGWQPEGIATGRGTTFFVGSIPTGAIYRGDLRTGEGAVFVQSETGRAATGLKYAGGRLYVSGASTGKAFVYDATTGALLKEYLLAAGAGATFVNDVVVTKSGAYFTDSQRSAIYRVPKDLGAAQTIPLTGDFQFVPGFNLNGIDATANGKTLVAVQSNTGKLFTIDPATGATRLIDLGGATLMNGDGILLHGKTLYVVQNRDNKVAVVRLASNLASGTVQRTITDSDLDSPRRSRGTGSACTPSTPGSRRRPARRRPTAWCR